MASVVTARPAGNLPAEVTSFVGRRTELSEVQRLLGECRLVTLTGMGGVGKTRLALRAATELRRAFPDGVWSVELSALRDSELLVPTVTAVLGLPDQSSRSQLDALAGHLAGRRLLLILDTCEHVIDACALLAEVLLPAAPGLHILATSREPLVVPGEHVLRVSPFPSPEPGAPVDAPNDSMMLFTERAAAAVQGFSLTPENSAAVSRLCHRLDGLPLAIELAAVQTRALSVDQIAHHLDDRFRSSRGRRTTVGRHQTLRAAIEWSHELCTGDERLMWARLSVFPADFDLEGVEAICGGEGLPEGEVFELVIRLVEKSILQVESRAGGVRYRMLDTIREYGAERLTELGTRDDFRRRHRDWYSEMIHRAYEEVGSGVEQTRWAVRLASDHANLQEAMAFSFGTPGEALPGMHLAGAMWVLWIPQGFLYEGRLWLGRALAADQEPTAERARCAVAAAGLAALQADLEAARVLVDEARELSGRFNLTWSALQVDMVAGVLMINEDAEEARKLLESSWEGYRESDHLAPTALMTLAVLAGVCCLTGDVDDARSYAVECRDLSAGRDDLFTGAHAMWVIAFTEWLAGDLPAAEATARTCLRMATSVNGTVCQAMSIDLLAWCAASKGEHARIGRLLGAGDEMWKRLGPPLFGWRNLTDVREWAADEARTALGVEAYEAAELAGRQLDLSGALAYALTDRVPAAPPESPGGTARQPLTRREQEIAALVAEGMSNREIAERLVIAKRTVDSHVEHILAKLAISSRTQIAVWVAGRPGG